MVILVPDTTRPAASTGSLASARSGSSQVMTTTVAMVPSAIVSGIATRSTRTLRLAPLAGEHAIEPGLERVQMQHVGGGIGDLGLGQVGRPPVGELLLLGEVDPEQLAHEVLEPVLVGIGAGEPRGDLGAVERRRHDA